MTEFYRETIEEIEGDTPFSKLELALLAACKTGEIAFLPGMHELPEEDDTNPDREVRGPLIRYLLLGGCAKHRPHPKGVQLAGARITDRLDLEGATAVCALFLGRCRFDAEPVFMDATLLFLGLPGCHTPGLNAHRLTVANTVLLNQKFKATEPINLSRAQIEGALDCSGSQFEQGLNGLGMTVGADVFLSEGFWAFELVDIRGVEIGGRLDFTKGQFDRGINGGAMNIGASLLMRSGFTAGGPVDLLRATIAGQLSCIDAQFAEGLDGEAMSVGADFFLNGKNLRLDGSLDLTRSEIKGHLQIVGGCLNGGVLAQNLIVGATLSFKTVDGEIGLFDLENARLGKLEDDFASWNCVAVRSDGQRNYYLGGLRYEGLGPNISVSDRIRWLDRNSSIPDKDDRGRDRPTFDPQPYSQLAKVLTENGNRNGAARVLYAREHKLRANEHRRRQLDIDGRFLSVVQELLRGLVFRPIELLYGFFFGYGYQPIRSVYLAAALYAGSVGLYGTAYDTRQMAPADPVVLVSTDWTDAITAENACLATDARYPPRDMNTDCTMPLETWLANPVSKDHQSFNRWIYGADAIIPLVSLGQETAWAPSRDRGHWGWWGFHLAWVFQAAGGIIAAFGAALLTGAVGRKD